MIRANPLLGVRVTRRAGSNARKALTPEQVEQLAEMIGDDRPGYRELVLLLGYGGLRPNEAFALRRRHFGDDGSVLVVEGLVEVRGHLVWTDGKTHRSRTVALPPSIAADLHRHLARTVGAELDALVFTTPRGLCQVPVPALSVIVSRLLPRPVRGLGPLGHYRPLPGKCL